jgi:hypothetical protein
LLIRDRLAIEGKRVLRVIAQSMERPLESAAIPGEVRVTSELSSEDTLSFGNFSNRARSISVWVVGSASTKSAAASTVTALEADPT